MFCCGKDRITNYCPKCGKQLHLLGSLVVRLRHNRDLAQSRELSNVWANWANAVEELITKPAKPKPQEIPLELTTMADFEIHAIKNALTKTGYRRNKAAQMLGVGERTLYRKLKAYDLVDYKKKEAPQ